MKWGVKDGARHPAAGALDKGKSGVFFILGCVAAQKKHPYPDLTL